MGLIAYAAPLMNGVNKLSMNLLISIARAVDVANSGFIWEPNRVLR